MNNKDLISKLASNNTPVVIIQRPLKSLVLWLGLSFMWLGLGLSITGFRKDFRVVFNETSFVFFSFVIFALALSSAYSSLSFSIPDRHKKILSQLPFIILGSWITALLFFSHELTINLRSDLHCFREVFLFSSVPAYLLFRHVRKGSVLQTTLTGILSLLAAAGLGALAVHFICKDSFGVHQLLWHVPPVVILGGIGILVGRKLKVL